MILTSQLDSLGCTGAIGDVKYSILAPDDFKDVNGDCWTLMDGTNISSTKLGAFGFSNIPDARGVFIRAVDNKTSDRTDPSRTFGEPVGKYVDDAFQGHWHKIQHGSQSGPHSVPAATANQYSPGTMVGTYEGARATTVQADIDNGVPRIAEETRPKSISLYMYIRIN